MTSKRSLFHQWSASGVLDKKDLRKALEVSGILPKTRDWRIFLDRLLLWTAIVALACSVIFFFAYNWHAMGKFAKFGLLEAAIVAAVIAYWRIGPDREVGKGMLFMAVILFGGLLALFGQTYQTGADPWQLFANWALLALPWVMIGCFVPLWLVWIGLVNTSLYLYFSIFPGLWGFFFSFEAVLIATFLFNTTALIIWEVAGRKIAWLQQRWAIRVVGVLSGTAVSGLAMHIILDWHDSNGWSAIFYPIWLTGIYYTYRHIKIDLFMLAGLCLSFIVVITALLIRTLLDFNDAGGFLLIAVAVIAMSAISAVWLKTVHKELEI